jgi:hypothetical protein
VPTIDFHENLIGWSPQVEGLFITLDGIRLRKLFIG